MFFFTVLFGYAAKIIPRAYTYYISTALFAVFGIKMLREGFKMSPNEGQDELEEVQADLRRKDDEVKIKFVELEIFNLSNDFIICVCCRFII